MCRTKIYTQGTVDSSLVFDGNSPRDRKKKEESEDKDISQRISFGQGWTNGDKMVHN